jgi:hypothetical protein
MAVVPAYMSNNLVSYSAEVLAHSQHGMTWTQIARFFRKKSVEYKVAVPYGNTIFPSHLLNRSAGFMENLKAFSPEQQVVLLMELCDAHKKANVTPLKKILMRYCQTYRVPETELIPSGA